MQTIPFLSAPDPWPPVKVERPNPRYAAEMLSNIGSCDSEMTALALCLYGSAILSDTAPALSEAFRRIGMAEMRHLELFSRLAHLLGADPRLWICGSGRPCYWSPACSRYPTRPDALLRNAITQKQAVIDKYRRQSQETGDAYLADLLDRVLLDERLHLEILRQMLAGSCPRRAG